MKFDGKENTRRERTVRCPPWDRATVLEFLGHYKDEPVLWNRTYGSKNKVAVDEAWARIAQKMSIDCSVKDLKYKKEGLLRAYKGNALIREFNRNYKPSWFAFELMDSFMGPMSKNDCFPKRTKICSIPKTPGTKQNSKTGTANKQTKPEQAAKSGAPRPKNTSDQSQTNEQTNTAAKHVSKGTNTTEDEPDECELFSKLLARKLRRLDEDRRDAAMHDINRIMYCMLLRNITEVNNVDHDIDINNDTVETAHYIVPNDFEDHIDNGNTNSFTQFTTDGNKRLVIQLKTENDDSDNNCENNDNNCENNDDNYESNPDNCESNAALSNVEIDGQDHYSENEIEYLEEHIESDNSDIGAEYVMED